VGKYRVRINITDGQNGYDEHYFILSVNNVNDAPEIIGAPEELEVNASEKYIWDLSPYIEDVDNELSELTLETTSNNAQTDGLTVIFDYRGNVRKELVKITVSDPLKASGSHIIIITSTAKEDFPFIDDKSPTGSNAAVSSEITITFTRPMNKSSVENAFSVSPDIKGDFTWVENKIFFRPDSDLAYNTNYTVTLGKSAEDQNNNKLGTDFIWSFTTEREDDEDRIDPVKKGQDDQQLPLLIIAIIIILIIVAVLVFFMKKRRIQEPTVQEQDEQPPEAEGIPEPSSEPPQITPEQSTDAAAVPEPSSETPQITPEQSTDAEGIPEPSSETPQITPEQSPDIHQESQPEGVTQPADTADTEAPEIDQSAETETPQMTPPIQDENISPIQDEKSSLKDEV
jgi:hypothetical protein